MSNSQPTAVANCDDKGLNLIERKNRVSSSASIERELGVQPVTTEAYVMTGIAAKYVIEISSIHHHVKLHAPTIGAAAYLRMAGRPPILPSNLSYSENVLYRLDSLGDRSYKPNPKLARVLEIPIMLHAEHEMNCSTAPARHLASSDVDVYAAPAGAVGALYGPLHGGANEVTSTKYLSSCH